MPSTTARSLIVLFAGLLTLSAALPASGQDLTATVELRVWQRIEDPLQIYVSARHEAGSWAVLGTIPLPLDRENSSRTLRYGDTSLEVLLASGEPPQPAGRADRAYAAHQDHNNPRAAR